jgi:hypothetical protein
MTGTQGNATGGKSRGGLSQKVLTRKIESQEKQRLPRGLMPWLFYLGRKLRSPSVLVCTGSSKGAENMYKMIPALIPGVLAASIGSASAQSPPPKGSSVTARSLLRISHRTASLAADRSMATVTPIRRAAFTTHTRVRISTYTHRVRSEYDGIAGQGVAGARSPAGTGPRALGIARGKMRHRSTYLSPAR